MSLKNEIKELYYSISADIEHGECFYSQRWFDDYCKTLDELKQKSIEYFNENKLEMELENE